MELVLKEIINNKKSISIACIQWFITTAISKCTLDIILRFSSILAKILVTPITMILNFIVMKGVVENL